MIPRNTEHHEAYQAEVDKKRQEMIESQPPDIQEKFAKIESAVKVLESLNVPFSLHINPWGWSFRPNGIVHGDSIIKTDDEKHCGYMWYGKFHKGDAYTKESNDTIIKASLEWICQSVMLINGMSQGPKFVLSCVDLSTRKNLWHIIPPQLAHKQDEDNNV